MEWLRKTKNGAKNVFSTRHFKSFGYWLFAPRKLWYRIPLVALLVFVVVSIISRLDTPDVIETPDPLRQVSLLSVSDIAGNAGSIALVGEVSSLSKAELRADAGGRVTRIAKHLGDHVGAGQIIAEFENAAQRAGVLQAEGQLESAKASLMRLENGNREETLSTLATNKERADKALADTKEGIVSSLKSIYGSNNNAIHGQIDAIFSNPRTTAPTFLLNTSDSRLVSDIESQRSIIETLLAKQAARAETLSASANLESELTIALSETRTISEFVDMIANAVNRAIPSSSQSQEAIAGHITMTGVVRTAVSASLQSISGLAQDHAAKVAASKNAAADLSQGITPARTEDIAQSQAGVKSAQGTYALALAGLEKTIIRSPISGTLDALSVNLGDNVMAGILVASVSNNNGLIIRTSVTGDDAPFIHAGSAVNIEGGLVGRVSHIGSGLDPVTKKVSIEIAVDDLEGTLSNGEALTLSITRSEAPKESRTEQITLPLSAVKLFADRTVVFTVGEDSRLVEHPIVLGPLLGDSVIVESGVSADMHIVKDARGLKTGEEVEVSAS